MPHQGLNRDNGRTLYEQVAAHVEGLVTSGTIRPGERVPSVRRLRQQLSVSASTVLEAYRLLETRGLIRVKPQSGYYVREPVTPVLDEPGPSTSASGARSVNVISIATALSEKVDQPNLIRFGAAVPDPALLPLMALNRLTARLTRQSGHAAHTYAAPPGHLPLRRQIAKRLIDAGCSLSPDDVLITTGASEAVHLALRAVTRPGDTVAIESPTYYGFLEVLESLQLKAWEISTCPREGFHLDSLEPALQSGEVQAVLLSTNFTNPMGTLMSEAKKRRLADLAATYHVPVIEDEVYAELGFEDTRPPSLKAFDRGDWVLTLGSLSKTLSPGLRVGWCCPPPRFAESLMRLKLTTSHASASLPQLVAATYLAEGGYDRHLRRLRRRYAEQTAKLRQALARHFPPATRLTRPRGGHVMWVEMPTNVDAIRLCQKAIDHAITLAPGPSFSPSSRFRHCLRLNAGLAWSERIEQAVAILGRLVHEQLAGVEMHDASEAALGRTRRQARPVNQHHDARPQA